MSATRACSVFGGAPRARNEPEGQPSPRAIGRAGSADHSLHDPAIEPRAAKPGVLHREQVVARRDARAARVHDRRRRATRRSARRSPRAARSTGLKRAVGRHVVGVRTIDRARDVAGDLVDRLDVAAKALAAARVDEQHRRRDSDAATAATSTAGTVGRATNDAGTIAGTSVVTGRPSRVHTAKPPSSTAAAS